MKHRYDSSSDEDDLDIWTGDTWSEAQLQTAVQDKPGRCFLLIDGYVVDATSYLREHPGGAELLRTHAVDKAGEKHGSMFYDATWAFQGGFNVHSRIARLKMKELRVAKLI